MVNTLWEPPGLCDSPRKQQIHDLHVPLRILHPWRKQLEVTAPPGPSSFLLLSPVLSNHAHLNSPKLNVHMTYLSIISAPFLSNGQSQTKLLPENLLSTIENQTHTPGATEHIHQPGFCSKPWHVAPTFSLSQRRRFQPIALTPFPFSLFVGDLP